MAYEMICTLCSDTLENPTATHCGHVFCWKCLDPLFKSPTDKITCPVCGTSIISKANLISLSLVKEVNCPEAPPLGKWQLPLHQAAYTNNQGEVRKLVNSGMDMYMRTGYGTPGYCPIHIACMMGAFEVVKFMTERSPPLRYARSIVNGELPIHTASANGRSEIVQFFVQNGVDLNLCCTAKGRTPLHFCCEGGHLTLAQKLLKHGANATALTNSGDGGNAPIHVASSIGYLDIVKLFVDKDPKLATMENGDGELPLHKAASTGRISIMEYFLIMKKVKVDSKCAKSQRTALIIACENGNLELVDLLIRWKADVRSKDKNGDTALHWAALNGHLQVVKRLVELAPPLINNKDNDGDSALDWAKSGQNPGCNGVVQFLSL